MGARGLAYFALGAVLAVGCGESTSPQTSLAGTYVADSIICFTTFDTAADLTAIASLTLVLRPNGTIGGRLMIPAAWTADGIAATDSLYGEWTSIPGGFRVAGPWSSLLTRADFEVHADTARARIVVRGFPLEPFYYLLRLPRTSHTVS